MTLTDAQIDRYSRQIIVPHIGGRGQERLLAARMLLVGDARDIEAPLAYLVGAGVGTIAIRVSDNSDRLAEMISASRELNPDVSATIAMPNGSVDLALAILGSEAARKVADEIANDRDVKALVIAHLDPPEKIIVIPDTQSPRIIDESSAATGSLGGSHYGKGLGVRSSDFIAMLAITEAFKLLA
ncbi:MAG TPA: hypothetical protein VE243_10470, partial [Candidatus Acidoferrum sp.]|nr:hypothetical protein [Candidatus Acidoferrum sp.]